MAAYKTGAFMHSKKLYYVLENASLIDTPF